MAINGQRVLAVIPARGGSKRCPRKNLREYNGITLIQRAVSCAAASRHIDEFLVSTEDQEIKKHAEEVCFAPVIERPAELATDEASNEDVLRHALKTWNSGVFGWIVLLQPTSPKRTAADIDTAIEKAQLGNACISYRQDGTKNGAVYVAKVEWLKKNDFSSIEHMKYVMPEDRSLDIDYPADFDR